jgi:hypothetical protein
VSTPDPHADRPRRLPIQVPLRPGEHPVSFLRRLAEANHLRPSSLRIFVNVLPGKVGSISVDRLAAITGRTPDQLRRVMPLLPPGKLTPPSRAKPRKPKPRQRRRASPKPRQRQPPPLPRTPLLTPGQLDPAALAVIADLSERFGLPHRIIIKALAGHVGPRDHRRPHHTPSLREFAGHIEQILAAEPKASVRSIWQHLTTEHGAKVSYGTVRNHVNRLLASPDDPRSLKDLISRAELFDAIREHAAPNLPPPPAAPPPAASLLPEPAADPQALADQDPPPDQPTPADKTPVTTSESDPIPDEREPDGPAPTAVPTPRPKERNNNWRARCLERWPPSIDQMIAEDPQISALVIWGRLVDEHHATISYSSVRHHVSQIHRPSPLIPAG